MAERIGSYTLQDDGHFSEATPITIIGEDGAAVLAVPGSDVYDPDAPTDPATWDAARKIARALDAVPDLLEVAQAVMSLPEMCAALARIGKFDALRIALAKMEGR